ncbi:hypothetical protein Nepgr_024973 [Nepenthes gracilis]|uniref:Uncharacterized protein n=1 Tax=Nepenthes gracilis TaxID=150966 RepID=A0AAD3Y0L5_NEPGR|nr:hypothetical protein Nepgr_024973 [Nepenthes gracilis]
MKNALAFPSHHGWCVSIMDLMVPPYEVKELEILLEDKSAVFAMASRISSAIFAGLLTKIKFFVTHFMQMIPAGGPALLVTSLFTVDALLPGLLSKILDSGGVKCQNCPRNLQCCYSSSNEKPDGDGSGTIGVNYAGTKHLDNYKNGDEVKQQFVSQNVDTNGFPGQRKGVEGFLPPGDIGTTIPNLDKSSPGLTQKGVFSISSTTMAANDICESLSHPNLSMSLGDPTGNPLSFRGLDVEERELGKLPTSIRQGFPTCYILPKPSKSAVFDTNVSMIPKVRVARPPVEGRGRNQLLPRYWPRITDQELQQISGDSNCSIVPLFEKVLSASDAGRIGRLVLPKACAEAYFPPISQPEGLPLKIQDVKGKEWAFQFRFWPNNNSRMYVLEGVTPCIQSMQLQAGDTVTFSRMDPEGKLVMGFRKASDSLAAQPLKGSSDPSFSALSRQLKSINGLNSWNNGDKCGGKTEDDMLFSSMLLPERKKSRNIGSKSKRLLIDAQEVLEMRLTWEEAQDMLRPPQSAQPSTVLVEDYEFEEYEEPPVFGKWTIFAVRSSGLLEQWTQCDSCFKWRRIPVDVLLPPKWTCAESVWDQSRCSCSVPDELSPLELENFLQLSKDFKKKRIAMSHGMAQDEESNGLDALANAAALGDNTSDPSPSSVATTTKHPRHRPGCSCIVCIQPPSGKGKHKPTCTCNVCTTVKRRFKTLMMRKKKRQSEQEVEVAALGNDLKRTQKHEPEADSTVFRHGRSQHDDQPENEAAPANDFSTNSQSHDSTTSKWLDLNSHPVHEGDSQTELARVSMMSLLQLASLPLETYMKKNGLTSLTSEQQAGEIEGQLVDDNCTEQEERQEIRDDESPMPDKSLNDPQ